jgi:glycosyltransferase AglD
MKKIQFSIVSIGITLGLAAYFFSNHSIRDVLDAIRNVPLPYILSFLCFSTLMSVFRTWRYYLLLVLNGYKVPGLSLFFITIVRNLFADLLPARLGTLIYVYLVRTRLGVSLGAGTSSFSYSFLFDLIGNCPILLFCIISLNLPDQIPGTTLAVGVILLLIMTVLVIKILPSICGLAAKVTAASRYSAIKGISEVLRDTEKSLLEVQSAKIYDRILLLSIAIRLSKYAGLYVFLLGLGVSLGLDKKMLDPAISLIGLLSAEFAASLPVSGIAGFGAYEGAWAFTFTLLGIDLRMAEITAVSHHLFTQMYAYTIGIASMLILLIPYFYRANTPSVKHSLAPMLRFYLSFFITITSGILLAALPLTLTAQNNRPPAESAGNDIISWSPDKYTSPDIIFDSNRDGTFGIYGISLSSGATYRMISSEKHEMFPDINKERSLLVFSRHQGLQRGGPSDIILRSLQDGTETIIDEGAFPTFSSDGTKIFYEKNRSQVMEYSLNDKSIRLLFPSEHHSFGKFQIVKPRLSPDNSRLVFTSDKGGRWHAWMISLDTGEELKIGHGCEPVFHPTENKIIWVSEKNVKERSGLTFYDMTTKQKGIYHDLDAPWGHEYFPSFSRDGTQLIYSASPPGEHSHEHAKYQIFIKNVRSGELKRITNDSFTNRWGKFIY